MKVYIKVVIHMSAIAWKEVTNATISNCLRKAAFLKEEFPQDMQELTADSKICVVPFKSTSILQHHLKNVSIDSGVITRESLTE